ncbi:dirigent protein 2-like [Vitis vinifera]|nr:dirigent protein 2-like [Vitis vinifera]|eukprot:XP_002270663.2 PREDICTED: dirigent protein 2-like [Vitis vinifera]
MHDWETGANVTAIPIAGLPKKPWAVGTFATIIPIDDALTETIDRNSAQIGRAQGIYVNSALDGSDLHFLMSVVFTNKQYNGSSLEIQGADRFFNKYREVSVVSGTGMFRNGAVLSVPGKIWSFTSFGTVFVTDDPITEAPDPNSAPVGRGRGMYITSALDGSTTHVLISIVFTNGQFSGSTLEIQGSSPPFQKYREVSVVSGTGPLRFARGYAIFETGFVDTPIGYSVIKCNVTIRTA